ncbi:hypothetical protein K503DRAFT_766006 [Rhizopogon vinicolor AM-OR11-026]|uniref:Uncharacterized protein n=1 Tax=Rhizopogon vinicolor AM-OR11-026 TaxID=1314800 RepID=A0A1B7NEB9_9AGAM|nr:hypothetical protein K503DRAFT_766006 [Rhizopogon vinicolor AM-OR11-026]
MLRLIEVQHGCKRRHAVDATNVSGQFYSKSKQKKFRTIWQTCKTMMHCPGWFFVDK